MLLCFFSSGTSFIFSSISASFSSIFAISRSPRSLSSTAAAKRRILAWMSSIVAAARQTTTGTPSSRMASAFSQGSHGVTMMRSGESAATCSTDGLRVMTVGIFPRTHGTFVCFSSASESLTAAMRSGSTRPSIISSVPALIVKMRRGLCGISTTVPSASVTRYALDASSLSPMHPVRKSAERSATHVTTAANRGYFFALYNLFRPLFQIALDGEEQLAQFLFRLLTRFPQAALLRL